MPTLSIVIILLKKNEAYLSEKLEKSSKILSRPNYGRQWRPRAKNTQNSYFAVIWEIWAKNPKKGQKWRKCAFFGKIVILRNWDKSSKILSRAKYGHQWRPCLLNNPCSKFELFWEIWAKNPKNGVQMLILRHFSRKSRFWETGKNPQKLCHGQSMATNGGHAC